MPGITISVHSMILQKYNDQIIEKNKIGKVILIKVNLMSCQDHGHMTIFLKWSKM